MTLRVVTRTRTGTLAGTIAIAIILAGAALPAVAPRSVIQDLFTILTLLTLAQLWNLLAGYGGLVSVGQQACVGIGAYAMFAGVILWGWDPVLAIPLGGLAALALAVPTAFFAFRLQGACFAIGTATVRTLFDVREAAARDILAYWLALALAALTIAAIYWLLRNRLGLALAAVRDNSEAAKSVGVDARRIKWAVFLIAAFVTVLTGALIYKQTARISPDAAFSVTDWTACVIFIVVIGGIGRIEGPILGVMVFYALQSTLADYGAWYLLTLDLIAIAVMLFAPRGLWGLLSDRTGLHLFPVQRRLEGIDLMGGK